MRFSSWSSDVCSSDLDDAAAGFMHRVGHRLPPFDLRVGPQARRRGPAKALLRDAGGFGNDKPRRGALAVIFARELVRHEARSGAAAGERRSEEHTSELQTLMRLPYAVFCLKKKK